MYHSVLPEPLITISHRFVWHDRHVQYCQSCQSNLSRTLSVENESRSRVWYIMYDYNETSTNPKNMIHSTDFHLYVLQNAHTKNTITTGVQHQTGKLQCCSTPVHLTKMYKARLSQFRQPRDHSSHTRCFLLSVPWCIWWPQQKPWTSLFTEAITWKANQCSLASWQCLAWNGCLKPDICWTFYLKCYLSKKH